MKTSDSDGSGTILAIAHLINMSRKMGYPLFGINSETKSLIHCLLDEVDVTKLSIEGMESYLDMRSDLDNIISIKSKTHKFDP